MKEIRAAMVAQGFAPAPIAALAANMIEHHNPGGASVEARNNWAEGPDGITANAPVLYFPGCAASYDTPAEARAIRSVLCQAGVLTRLLNAEEAGCCGAPLREIGYVAEADAERQKLVGAISRSGCRRVVISGVECLESLGGAQLGDGIELLHAFDLVERWVVEGQIGFEPKVDAVPGPIGLLDPCHLSKKSHGIIGAASYPRRTRELLERLRCQMVAIADQGFYAVCCGGAGGMPQMSPQSAARMAEGKLQSFARA